VLLGLHVSKAAGITVEDLKKVLQICDPESLERREADAVKIAFTLLACVTYLSPRQAGATVPKELLECVLVPDQIGEYDWGGYLLDQLSNAAKKKSSCLRPRSQDSDVARLQPPTPGNKKG
jgi:hypothetical protein